MLTRTGQLLLLGPLATGAAVWLAVRLSAPAGPPAGEAPAIALAARSEPSGATTGPHAPTAEPAPPAPSPPAEKTLRLQAGRPRTRTRVIRMLVTAYCPCRTCCGRHSDGKTASGKSIHANGSRFVAADTRILAFGTRVSVPGYHGGAPVSVLDRGGRIKGRRLDVFFPSHARARRWGARWLDVTVYEAATR